MTQKKLTEKELQELRTVLINTFAKKEDKEFSRNDKNSAIWKSYSSGSKVGRQVYQSFTDEELLAYLRSAAAELDHAPAQRELFWVFRDYIKLRFGKWPYALKAAGLSTAAGKGGRTMDQTEADLERQKELLQSVRDKAYEMGKLPHPKEMPELCEEIKKYYTDWGSVLEAAKISPAHLNKSAVYKIDDLEPEYRLMLEAVESNAYEMGRAPMHGEIDLELKRALIKRCGSWRNALYQIGLEPVVKTRPFSGHYIDHRKGNKSEFHASNLSSCYYKVLNLDEEDKELLEEVRQIYQQTQKVPTKKDISKEARQRLQKSCGSWANALYQIGIDPRDCSKAVKEGKKNA